MAFAVGYDKQVKDLIKKAADERKAAADRVARALSEKERTDEVAASDNEKLIPKQSDL